MYPIVYKLLNFHRDGLDSYLMFNMHLTCRRILTKCVQMHEHDEHWFGKEELSFLCQRGQRKAHLYFYRFYVLFYKMLLIAIES